jgi:PAS domain S-box-containing protein
LKGAGKLRHRAEQRLRQQPTGDARVETTADAQRILHELQVHQVELELQNEELRQAKAEVEAGLEKYTDLYDFSPVGYFTLAANGAIQLVNLTGASLVGIDRSHLMGRPFGQLLSSAHRPAFNSFLKQVFAGQNKQSGDFELASQGEPTRTVNIKARCMPSGLECRAVVADVTQRLRDAEILRASEESYRALFELSPVAVYSIDPSGLIRQFNRHAVELWGREPALGDTDERFCGSFKMFRPDGSFMPHEQSPMAEVVSGRTAETRDAEVLIERPDGSRVTVLVNICPMRNGRGEITGAINCFYDITERKRAAAALHRAEVLSASNEKLAKSEQLAQQLLKQSHLQQIKLRHVSHQILQAQESLRKEISRELHDKVVQLLVSINVNLAVFGKVATNHPGSIPRKITPLLRLVDKAVQTVHQFARDLRPAMLDDLGLIPTLHSYLSDFSKRTGLKVKFKAVAGLEALDNDRLTMLYRVAQEALTNVEKHAGASRVSVTILKDRAGATLEVIDDGRAFDVSRLSDPNWTNRLGLTGMRERAEMFGGRFSVVSTPGVGTIVRAEVPLGQNRKRK